MDAMKAKSLDDRHLEHTRDMRRRLANHVKHRTTDLVAHGMLIFPTCIPIRCAGKPSAVRSS
jgi:hypothetical protein